MKKVFLFLIALAINNLHLCADEFIDSLRQVQLEEITISALRVSPTSAIAHSNVGEQQIKTNNAAQNIPSLLQMLPSVVSYNEGGTPVGNTSFRIRGTDANRISMTLNGMPLNNPETQEVYWVNIPDLSNSLKSLQVQRGVGTSTAGTASFGGNISMLTVGSRVKPYASLSSSFGHYNTFLTTASTGTGVLKNGLSLDARYSYVSSDGYIRNGKVNHKNLYANISHYTDKQMARIVYINGIQHTGITWEGISPDELEKYGRRYNSAGKYKDDEDKTKFYDNETDNYYSNILQAIYSRYLSSAFTLNANFGYNNGYGYYENYKKNRYFEEFGILNQTIGDVEHITSDIVRRKIMRNNLYSGGTTINYKENKLDITVGANYTHFEGDHYGRLMWIKYNQNIDKKHEWYRNKAKKKDFNTFLKFTYSNLFQNLDLTAEVQGRFINYKLNGIDDDREILLGDKTYFFFNPKLGASYKINKESETYFSFAISNREPLRADLKESLKGDLESPIDSEKLFDYEFGYRFHNPEIQANANFYYMDYKNQLVQTGKLSDSGYKYQENVPTSYRYGMELEAMINLTYWMGVGANLTLSQNKIKNYTAYFDLLDNPDDEKYLGQTTQFHKKTNISFSPNVIGAAIIKFKPFIKEDFSFMFANKYVGSMYYDNTSNRENKLNDYFITNFQISYSKAFSVFKSVEFQFMVNNIFNKKYIANAWVETSKFADGSSDSVYKGLFPQVGTNVMGRISINF